MKKVSLLLMVALVATVSVWSAFQQKEVMDELLLSNVEALADNELEHGRCYGSGNVTCINGVKVAYAYGLFSLR